MVRVGVRVRVWGMETVRDRVGVMNRVKNMVRNGVSVKVRGWRLMAKVCGWGRVRVRLTLTLSQYGVGLGLVLGLRLGLGVWLGLGCSDIAFIVLVNIRKGQARVGGGFKVRESVKVG